MIDLQSRRTRALEDVAAEAERAATKHRPMAGAHEGWAVIKEELDELWEHVRADTGRSAAARREAVQIAAMAIRYITDVTEGGAA
ncbi:hypothetical protein [Roseospira goensis]|uniref:Uncharacterized protein n=1 Tax=Roseospira goensis TaxID=391922 RepID=A0A7W6S3C5_9PROT|nr:hypothetical protein [Roseospira goensis]MBB4287977.1 hypothetical protein [Roseospira goensis]